MTFSDHFKPTIFSKKPVRARACLRPMGEVEMACLNGPRSKSVHTFLFAGLLTIGLVASTAIPALAASFNKTGSMNSAREYHTATLLANGQVLVTGGDNFTQGFLASAELYNPATGKWTLTGNMSVPRVDHDAVLLQNGKVLVAGGYNAGPGYLASAELYNPTTGTWTATGSMTTGRAGFVMKL